MLFVDNRKTPNIITLKLKKRKEWCLMNKVILSGSIATAPRKVAEGIVIFNMVAIDEYNPRARKNETDLVPVKVMGKRADYVFENGEVGQQVEVVAKMSSRKTDDGKFFCDVVARDVRLGHKSLKKAKDGTAETEE